MSGRVAKALRKKAKSMSKDKEQQRIIYKSLKKIWYTIPASLRRVKEINAD